MNVPLRRCIGYDYLRSHQTYRANYRDILTGQHALQLQVGPPRTELQTCCSIWTTILPHIDRLGGASFHQPSELRAPSHQPLSTHAPNPTQRTSNGVDQMPALVTAGYCICSSTEQMSKYLTSATRQACHLYQRNTTQTCPTCSDIPSEKTPDRYACMYRPRFNPQRQPQLPKSTVFKTPYLSCSSKQAKPVPALHSPA